MVVAPASSRNEDTDSVLIHCAEANEFICEAWDTRAGHPRYTLADVKESRREEKQRLQSLSERSKRYYENVSTNDRLVEQRKGWEQAREIAAQLPSAEPETNLEEEELTNAMEMLRRLQRERE